MMKHAFILTILALCCSFCLSSDDVIINSVGDRAPNATECLPQQANNHACTLRSAFSFCALNFSLSSQCHIYLPPLGLVMMNSSLGPIVVSIKSTETHTEEVVLHGAGSTVTLAPAFPALSSSGLVSFKGDIEKNSVLVVQNMSFTNFTETVFTLSNVNAVVEECQFLDNSALNGAAMHLELSSRTNITNCLFNGNTAAQDGGALYASSEVNHMTLSDCSFSENNAGSRGGVMFFDRNSIQLSLLDSNFTGNSATGGGGVLHLHDDNDGCFVKNCQFVSNLAEGGGGAIMAGESSHMEVTASLFSHNLASRSSGGAVYLNDATNISISSCIFLQNKADINRGACVLYAEVSNVILSRNSFTGNEAASSGGGVYIFIDVEDVSIRDSSFVDNVARSGDENSLRSDENMGRGGGAVFLDSSNSDVQVTRCNLVNNSAPFGSGGGFFVNSNNQDITLMECNLTDNHAYRGGGGVYFGSGNADMVVRSNRLVNNSASLIGGGACFVLAHNSITVVDTLVWGNYAVVGGGFLFLLNNFFVKVEGCVFEGNQAALRGGGVNLGMLHEAVLIEDTEFTRNWAAEGGGLYADDASSVTIQRTTFLANVALSSNSAETTDTDTSEAFGGAIYSTSGDFKIISSTFDGNVADEGGALYMSGNKIGVTSSVFASNTAKYTGGAAKFLSCNDVTLLQCNFTGNSNSTVNIMSSVAVSILSSRITDSRGINGGAIVAASSEHVTLSGCFLSDNFVSGVGGALYLSMCSSVTVEASSLEGNRATQGGAVCVESSKYVTVYSNTIHGNRAVTSSGGGVSLADSSGATVHLNTFENNSALQGGGGGVYWLHDGGKMMEPSLINDNIFAGNVALYGNSLATDAVAMEYAGNRSTGESNGGANIPVAKKEGQDAPLSVSITTYNEDVYWLINVVDKYGQLVTDLSSTVNVVASESFSCGSWTASLAGRVMAPIEGGQANMEFTSSCNPGGVMEILFLADLSTIPNLEVELYFRSCYRGEYYYSGACVQCPNGSYSLVEHTNETAVTTCSTCPDHTSCYGDVIIVDSGYWRISSDADNVFTCPLDGACAGGGSAGDTSCNTGYTGVLCGVCEDEFYYPSLTATCEACADGGLQIGLVILLAIIGFAAIGLCVTLCGGKIAQECNSQTGHSYFARKWRATHLTFAAKKKQFLKSEDTARKYQNKLKQLITLFQILTAFPSILSMTFPNIYYTLTSALNVINMGSLLKDLGLVCSFNDLDYISTVVGATLVPIVMSIALYIVQRVHCHIVFNQYSHAFREVANTYSRVSVLKSTYQYVFLFFTYLILPGVSTVLFGMLKPCTNVDPDDVESGDQMYLEADYSIQCHGARYRFGVTWAIIGCFVYPIGIPCYYVYLLYHSKDLIQSRARINVNTLDRKGLSALENISMKLSALKFLFQEYQPQFWYFEIIETFRKLFLTSVLSVISPGSTKQLVFGNLFVVLCLILYVCVSPFDDVELSVTSAVCQLQIWFVLFLGILIKENVHISSTFIEVSIAFAILFIFVYEFFLCVIEFCPLPKPVQSLVDRVIVSKSYPPPACGGSGTSDGQGPSIEEALNRAMEVVTNSVNRSQNAGKGSLKKLTEKHDAIERSLAIVDKLQTLLKLHQTVESEKLFSVTESCYDEESEEEEESMGGGGEQQFLTIHEKDPEEKQKSFVKSSLSFSDPPMSGIDSFDEVDHYEEVDNPDDEQWTGVCVELGGDVEMAGAEHL